ncbi:hypothetical protein ST47_g4281 [Ascochyta rabiei]|uniref:Uncharacterized protein n=1 Tax=Didymella rabiei TaxID=5454 RepID=A0A163G1K1_DIDRA|nr:hypothetical protein ST47_g4281 [Ascochyta rabiei]
MKVNNLTFSIIGFASLATAQNGNDPLILNNRTGLAPVVYDTFSTSYTKLPVNETAGNGLSQVLPVTAPVTQSPVYANTFFPKPTTSVPCWRDGYPCGQDGGKRIQRRIADFVRATPAPTIEDVPARTGEVSIDIPRFVDMAVALRVPPPEFFNSRPDIPVPGETGDATMNILPIPTELIDGTQYDAPPEPTSTGTAVTDIPSETSEAIFFILPISTLPPSTTARPSHWRGPVPSYTIDCNRHYCPTNTRSVSTTSSTPLPTTHPVIPPTEPYTTQRPAVPPQVTTPTINTRNAGVPIDWWRGPGQPIVPDHHMEAIAPRSSDCELHYCPSGTSTLASAVPGAATSKTTLSTVVASTGPGHASFPAVVPGVATGG